MIDDAAAGNYASLKLGICDDFDHAMMLTPDAWLIALAGVNGIGTSTFALQIACELQMAKDAAPVLWFTAA